MAARALGVLVRQHVCMREHAPGANPLQSLGPIRVRLPRVRLCGRVWRAHVPAALVTERHDVVVRVSLDGELHAAYAGGYPSLKAQLAPLVRVAFVSGAWMSMY